MSIAKRLVEYKMYGKPRKLLVTPKALPKAKEPKKVKPGQKALVFDEVITERPAQLDEVIAKFKVSFCPGSPL